MDLAQLMNVTSFPNPSYNAYNKSNAPINHQQIVRQKKSAIFTTE